MKATIRIDGQQAIVVQPERDGRISITLRCGAVPLQTRFLSPDQCGALLFGIEQAAETAGMQQARAAA